MNEGVVRIADETETTLRFTIFLLTLHYFRAMTSLRRQKSVWGGNTGPVSMSALGTHVPKTQVCNAVFYLAMMPKRLLVYRCTLLNLVVFGAP